MHTMRRSRLGPTQEESEALLVEDRDNMDDVREHKKEALRMAT